MTYPFWKEQWDLLKELCYQTHKLFELKLQIRKKRKKSYDNFHTTQTIHINRDRQASEQKHRFTI